MLLVFRQFFLRIFALFLLLYNFLLFSCIRGNEMSVLPPVIVNATSKHTASVSDDRDVSFNLSVFSVI